MSYRFRRPTQDDLPAVTELVRALWRAEGDEGDPTLVRQHALPHRPTSTATGGWSRTRTGRLVACGCVRPRHPHRLRTLGGVLPDHRGRGIGTELRDRIEERAREQAQDAPEGEEVWLGADVGAGNEGAKRFFEQRGYELLRHFWEMGIDLDEEPPEPEWPDGIRLEHARRGVDERAVHAASDEAFADHWDHHPTPYDEWARWMVESDNYDPSLWLLAWDGDEIAGYLALRPRSRTKAGSASSASGARGGGAASPPRSCTRASARSATVASPSRSSAWTRPTRPARRKLYESVGMRVLNEFLAYRLIVR